MFPKNVKAVTEAYQDSVSRPHGYLLFDLRQETPDKLRLKTNILPTDPQPAIAYTFKI